MLRDDKKTKKQLIDEIGQLRRSLSDVSDPKDNTATFKSREKQFRRAEEIAKIGSFVVDVTTGEMKWSDQVYRLLGLEPGEIKPDNESFWGFVCPEDQDRLTEEASKVFAGEAEMDIEYRIIRKDGQLRDIHTQSNSEFDDHGNLEYIWGFSQDITERKQAEEALLESINRYEDLFSSMIDGFALHEIICDESGKPIDYRFLAINPAFERLTGLKAADMIGKRAYEAIPGLEPFWIEKYGSVALTGEAINLEEYSAPLNKHFEITAYCPTPGQFACIFVDISERKYSQEALKESERRLSSHLQNTPIVAIEWNLDFEVTEWNSAAERVFGYTKDEAMGRHAAGLIVPESAREHVNQVWNGLLENTGGHHSTNENFTKHGRTIVCEWNNTSLIDEFGKVCGVASLVQDITHRKQIEKRLNDSERKSRAWLENSPVCTKVVDLDFNLQYMSTAGIEALNIEDITQLYGKPYPFDFYPDSFRKPMIKNLETAKETCDTITQEASVVDVDGNQLWFHSTIVPVNNEKGILDYLLVLSVETTERKRAEAALRESESRFRNLANATREGVGITEAGIIVEANMQMAEMMGYTMAEFIGLSVKDLIAPESRALVAHHTSTDSQAAYEHMALKRDGSTILVEARGRATLYKGKQVRVTAVRDITETKRLQALESRAGRLETAGVIAGQVAHDFNNLLAPLMAYPDFIRDELPGDHPSLEYVDRIEEAAQKIADINKDLLAMGRRGHYNLTVLDLNQVVRNALTELTPDLGGLECKADLSQELMSIMGGGAQLHRVISNLLHNAKDAMPESGVITVKTENCYVDDMSVDYGRVPKGEYVKLTVSDTGCGIPDDIVQKIFDPFFSSKKTDKRRGSGLGLSVVDAVVHDHRGYIDLVTEPGVGTSFYVYFPLTRVPIDTQAADETGGGTESILIVDDDAIQREVSSHLLTRLGYQVHSVKSGEAAIDFLRETPQDLVMLDMIMPDGIDGTETYRRILEFSPSQKTIILSGFSESDRVIETQRMGAGAFVQKPISKKTIAAVVRAELDKESRPTVV